jgi:hypothetical protein
MKLKALVRWSLLSACLCLAPVVSAEEGVEQRLDRLEAQMQRLIELMERQQTAAPAPAPSTGPAVDTIEVVAPPPAASAAPAAPAAPASSVAPAAAPAMQPAPATPAQAAVVAVPAPRVGMADIRYFVHDAPMGTQPPRATEPLAKGLFNLGEEISLKPNRYGIDDRWWLSEYRDPSRYRSAGVMIETDFVVERGGDHEFVLSPKPAREGAAGVSAEMSAVLDLDGRNLLRLEHERSWRARRATVTLPPGRYALRLWTAADSPGYGVSPIESTLKLEVRGPGEAAPGPLSRYAREPAVAR